MNNRKLLTFVIFLFCSATISLSAQNFFKKGDQIVNVGIGLGSYYGGTGYSMTVPPLSVSYEKGLLDGLFDGKGAIGVGGYLGYQANKWETVFSGNSYGYKYNYIMVGARGTLHYQFVEKLDTYGGLLLGYDIVAANFSERVVTIWIRLPVAASVTQLLLAPVISSPIASVALLS
jgi:hypothetical protein